MNYPMRSFRLYLAERSYSIYIAPTLLLGVVVLTVVVGLIIGINTSLPLPPEIRDGFRGNNTPLFLAAGFFISLAALAVNRTFATVLAFGGTRRDFWRGTALGFLVTAVIAGLSSVAFLAIEQATGGWWIGVPVMNTTVFGNGNYLCTFATMTLAALAFMFVGAAFGTIFRAFGPAGLVVSLVGCIAALAGVVALSVWQWDTTTAVLDALGMWSPTVFALVFGAMAAASSNFVIRRATV